MKKYIKVIVCLLICLCLIGCSSTDSSKFKKEYESLNGKKTEDNKHKYRSVSVPRKNKFVYATASDIVKKVENKESFVVYFGFSKCPWCRSVLEELIKASNDTNIDKIYYVDIYDIRDVMEYKDGKVVTTKEGSKDYMKLIESFNNILDDYTIEDDNGDEISAGEKRIYAPNVIAVINGSADKMTTGISDDLDDPYMKLTKGIKNYAYKNFKCIMNCVTDAKNVCTKDSKC